MTKSEIQEIKERAFQDIEVLSRYACQMSTGEWKEYTPFEICINHNEVYKFHTTIVLVLVWLVLISKSESRAFGKWSRNRNAYEALPERGWSIDYYPQLKQLEYKEKAIFWAIINDSLKFIEERNYEFPMSSYPIEASELENCK